MSCSFFQFLTALNYSTPGPPCSGWRQHSSCSRSISCMRSSSSCRMAAISASISSRLRGTWPREAHIQTVVHGAASLARDVEGRLQQCRRVVTGDGLSWQLGEDVVRRRTGQLPPLDLLPENVADLDVEEGWGVHRRATVPDSQR